MEGKDTFYAKITGYRAGNFPIYEEVAPEDLDLTVKYKWIDEKPQIEIKVVPDARWAQVFGKDYCANDFGFYSIFDTWCVRALVTQYGIDRVKALLDFAKKYNINDLAEYNSCLVDGAIKFFDYAGYGED